VSIIKTTSLRRHL